MTEMGKNTNFRSDIEGLRALAIIAVIAFHHQWGGFSGGFVGVDVFFVISGYLISRNILAETRNNTFSIKEFYIRRVRRLFPALFFTVALILLAGAFLSSPAGLQQVGASGIAAIFSVSNIYFWAQSGYFDTAAIQKPLLHTWSLSVEEQFYLIWPVLVVLLSRYIPSRRIALTLLATLGVLSVVAAEWWLRTDASGAFYLTPFRIGEFVLGAVCAWMPSRSPRGRLDAEVFSVIGLALIAYPVFVYTDSTSFPGMAALLPCMGAAMLIYFNGGGASRWILTNPLAAWIGKISYSLYLVHWPIFVFYRQWLGHELGGKDAVAIGLISFALATLMYQYVEQPFRARGPLHLVRIKTSVFAKIFISLTVLLVAVSASMWKGDGWAWRYPESLSELAREADAEMKLRFNPYRERCLKKGMPSCDMASKGANVFVIGDSHSTDLFNALAFQYPDVHLMFSGLGGCPPLTKEDFGLLDMKLPNRKACMERNEEWLYGNRLEKVDLIVINTVFSWYKPEHLAHTIEQLHKITKAPIVVFGNYLFFEEDFPDLVVSHGVTRMDEYYHQRLSKITFEDGSELESLSRRLGFTYISKRKLWCKNESVMSCPIIFDGKLFTYDRNHLSLAAARSLGGELEKSYGSIFKTIRTADVN